MKLNVCSVNHLL